MKIKRIYKGKVISLKKIEFKTGGKKIKKEIVFFPESVAILPLIGKDKIVLIRQYRLGAKKNLWEVPAGFLNKGEKPEKTAKRELKEETGFEAREIEKIGQAYISPGYSNQYMYFFKASRLKKGKQRLDREELINRVKIFSLKEALKMIKNKKIVDAKTILAILLYLKECK